MQKILLLFVSMLFASQSLSAAKISQKERQIAADKALKNLSKKIRGEGLSHPSGNTGQLVVYCTAGLAFLAEGSTTARGKYKLDVKKCYAFVKDNYAKKGMMNDPKWDQSTWSYSHVLIFLSALHPHSSYSGKKSIAKLCDKIVKKLQETQSPNGGWCHGPSGPNALQYSELVSVSNLALMGLGCAKKIKLKVDQKVIDKGLKYIENSSNTSSGAVGYSPNEGQKGFGDPGRTAGAILAFGACSKKNSFSTKMRSFMLSKLADAEKGHGSAQLNEMQTIWACQLAGSKYSTKFWGLFGKSILKRQKPDGSFSLPPGDAGAKMGGAIGQGVEGGDRATATHALMLLIPNNKLKAIMLK